MLGGNSKKSAQLLKTNEVFSGYLADALLFAPSDAVCTWALVVVVLREVFAINHDPFFLSLWKKYDHCAKPGS